VRGVVDRPSFSFGTYMTERPGGPTEIHSWIGTIFSEFRELELRLLMGKLGASLSEASVGKLKRGATLGALGRLYLITMSAPTRRPGGTVRRAQEIFT